MTTFHIARKPGPALLRRLACVLLSSLLASCAGMIGPRQVEVPLSKLQQGLDRHFPLDRRALALFQVELARPQLALLSDDRVGLTMEASVTPPFSQSRRGAMGMSGRLLVDPLRNAVFIADARVERFAIDGVDVVVQRQLGKVANMVADHVVRDVPVYSFKQEDLRYAGVQFVPTAIRTTPAALIVTFEPVK